MTGTEPFSSSLEWADTACQDEEERAQMMETQHLASTLEWVETALEQEQDLLEQSKVSPVCTPGPA